MPARRLPPPWSARIARASCREFNVASVWGSVLQLEPVSCLSRCSRSAGSWVPIRIYRAISTATGNDGRLALVYAVIVTVPTDDVAPVRHLAPMGISGLVGMTCSYVDA